MTDPVPCSPVLRRIIYQVLIVFQCFFCERMRTNNRILCFYMSRLRRSFCAVRHTERRSREKIFLPRCTTLVQGGYMTDLLEGTESLGKFLLGFLLGACCCGCSVAHALPSLHGRFGAWHVALQAISPTRHNLRDSHLFSELADQ